MCIENAILLEYDNGYGIYPGEPAVGTCANTYQNYGLDNITWFAMQPQPDTRNGILKYTNYQIKCIDHYAHFQPPGMRAIQQPPSLIGLPTIPPVYMADVKSQKDTIRDIFDGVFAGPYGWMYHNFTQENVANGPDVKPVSGLVFVGTDRMYYIGADGYIHGYIKSGNYNAGCWLTVSPSYAADIEYGSSDATQLTTNQVAAKSDLVASPDGARLLYIGVDGYIHGFDIINVWTYHYIAGPGYEGFMKQEMIAQQLTADSCLIYPGNDRIYYIALQHYNDKKHVHGFQNATGSWLTVSPSYSAQDYQGIAVDPSQTEAGMYLIISCLFCNVYLYKNSTMSPKSFLHRAFKSIVIHPIIFMCLLLFTSQAHAQNWLWATSPNTTTGVASYEYNATSITMDANGNVYSTGYFYTQAITFDTITITNTGEYGIFIVKYNPLGHVIWAKGASGGINIKIIEGVTTDDAENVYITGYFSDSIITFGTTTLMNYGDTALFIVKYDSSGSMVWAKSAVGESMSSVFSNSISSDKWGDIYIVGSCSGPSITFGTDTFASTGLSDMFIAKYDTTGNVIWVKHAGGVNCIANAASIATDATGHVYAAGYFYDSTIYFGTTTLSSSKTPSNPGNSAMFLTKYDSSGNILWSRKEGDTSNIMATAVASDVFGNIYLTGDFGEAPVLFGTTTLNINDLYPYTTYMFLAKYDTGGNSLWAKGNLPLAARVLAYSIAIRDSDIYVCGSYEGVVTFGSSTLTNPFSGTFYIVKYNANGYELGTINGSGNTVSPSYITTDTSGNIYITGTFTDTLILGSNILLNPTYIAPPGFTTSDIFVAKLDTVYTSGVPALSAALKTISIYPNPNNGQMTVSLPQAGYSSLQVYNSIGQSVYSAVLMGTEASKEIDMRGMPPGVYYVHAVNGKGSERAGFVVE